jgi:transposase
LTATSCIAERNRQPIHCVSLSERSVVVEGAEFDDEAGEVVVACRLRKGAARRCGRCGRHCGRYDQGEGRRRWRALDAGTIRVFIEADAPRVACPQLG